MIARLVKDGDVIEEEPLTYAGRKSTFEAAIALPEEGEYNLEVLAMDAVHANFGIVRRALSILPSR